VAIKKAPELRRAIFYSWLSASLSASSGCTGVEITYFSLAQLPRSMILQRSLQKGKNWESGKTSFLQMGHFIIESKPA